MQRLFNFIYSITALSLLISGTVIGTIMWLISETNPERTAAFLIVIGQVLA